MIPRYSSSVVTNINCHFLKEFTYQKLKVKHKNFCYHKKISLRHPCHKALANVTH